MKKDFFKFPSTPHLATLPDVDVRDDKVLSPSARDAFLKQPLVIEEKMDGANLGISFDNEGNLLAQNRGAYLFLPGSGQWKKLGEWLATRNNLFFECLSDRFILFGEWCYAQHSVVYDKLPDWFLGFDLYDKEKGRFFSSERRDRFFKKINIASVPIIGRGHFTYTQLIQLLIQSKFSTEPVEGLYLRIDEGDWLAQRAKLVRPAFVQSMHQHWSRSKIKNNQLLV